MKIIDVRTKEEYECGHIKDALLHDVRDIANGILPDIDKNEEIIVYCRSGVRAKMAKELLEKAGFKNVTNGGGMDDLFKSL